MQVSLHTAPLTAVVFRDVTKREVHTATVYVNNKKKSIKYNPM